MRGSWRRLAREGLVVTPRAFEQVGRSLGREAALRVGVEAGGCGGFQYRFEVDRAPIPETDVVYESGQARVVCDPESLHYLEGAVLDYQNTMMRAGYSILSNPQADMACGCGTSFSPKD